VQRLFTEPFPSIGNPIWVETVSFPFFAFPNQVFPEGAEKAISQQDQ
jgi:hypothetical protein